jgi:hypothetical protein
VSGENTVQKLIFKEPLKIKNFRKKGRMVNARVKI